MSIDSLLTLIGIFVALFALARPVQQKTIFVFSNSFLLLFSLVLSLLCFVFLDFVVAYHICISPISSFWVRLIPLIIGIIVIIKLYLSWKRAKLSIKRDKKFRAFINACLLENEFSELSRIVEKNEGVLIDRVHLDTLPLLFDRSFLSNQLSIRSHLHIRLLSDDLILEALANYLGIIDLLAREMLYTNNSLIQLAVSKEYGGEEHLLPNKAERLIIEKTIQSPNWYMKTRFDYPLIISVSEKILSGEYDLTYNRYNELYVATQGRSLRINCPIYLTLKTHILMLEAAIDQDSEGDFYVSDLFDLIRMICDHSKYDKDSWKEYDDTKSKPTTFAYLMAEINSDIAYLFNKILLKYPTRDELGDVGLQLSFIWPFCVLYVAESKDKVSDGYKRAIIRRYYESILELRSHNTHWGDKLIEDMKDKLRLSNANYIILFMDVIRELDLGKGYIFNNKAWLVSEIEEVIAGRRETPGI